MLLRMYLLRVSIMGIKEQLAMGKRLFDEKKLDKAQKIFEQILRIEPANGEALVFLCSIKISKGEFSSAQKILSSLNEKTKTTKTYWYWLGQIEAGLGDTDKAITAYKKALAIDSKYSQVYSLLIELLDQKEDFVNACKYLFQAIRHLGLAKKYEQKLKKYQQYFSAQGGIQAPAIIKIRKNRGSIVISLKKLEAIEDIKNLDVTSPILTNLDLSSNKIGKISGLEKLTELETLSLNSNNIQKIEGLKKLVKLKNLSLSNNKIQQFEGLENLRKLQTLNINNNAITSVRGLEHLTSLKILGINNNKLKSLEGIECLTNLSQLYLEGSSLSNLKGLSNLSKIYILKLSNNNLTSMQGLEKYTVLTELFLDNNELKGLDNIRKMVNLKKIDLRNNKDLPPSLAKVFDQNGISTFLRKVDGLVGRELNEKVAAIEKEQHKEIKQKLAFEKWQVLMNTLPVWVRFKFQKLFERNTSEKCLYCGRSMPANSNRINYCQEQFNSLLYKANEKLPEKLRSKIAIDTKEVPERDKYEMVGPDGQKTWQKTGLTSGLQIENIRIEKQSRKMFSSYDYIPPQGTICKSCTDEFIKKITPIFLSVSSTKSKKQHDKMHKQIKEKYYKVFEAMVIKAMEL